MTEYKLVVVGGEYVQDGARVDWSSAVGEAVKGVCLGWLGVKL